MASCELLSFLGTYSGYHQISLDIDDEEKTIFITSFGILCYTKMAFRLKNGGGGAHLIEAYIDNIVVKSKMQGDLFDDHKETFDNLRKYKMMLNAKKMCVWCII
jgi:hypothetical protein